MATFLTTSRMDPALRARIEASVAGRAPKAGGRRIAPRLVALIRFGLVLVLALGIYTVVTGRQRDRRELERTRGALLDAVRTQGAALTPEERGAVARAESWLTLLAGTYEDDLVVEELRAPGALKTTLARPAIYVRGQLGAFKSSRLVNEAASTSGKDALLLCLVEPPASRVEKTMLEKVRVAYGGGLPMEERTANVRRLHEAVVGLPLLLPSWSERVRIADDGAELARLKRELDRAPVERAKQAARANLLVVAIDEPGDGGGPTELDGERAHAIRVAVVDLAAAKVLLRIRKLVDPTWISLAKKSEYASGLDGCGLAFDVHESVARLARPHP
jgi:hypothetical protein